MSLKANYELRYIGNVMLFSENIGFMDKENVFCHLSFLGQLFYWPLGSRDKIYLRKKAKK